MSSATKPNSERPSVPRRNAKRKTALIFVGSFAGLLLITNVGLRWYAAPGWQYQSLGTSIHTSNPDIEHLIREVDDIVNLLATQFSDRPEAISIAAQFHARFGTAAYSAVLWNRCLELSPNFSMAHEALGVQSLEQGKHAEAEHHFKQAFVFQPNSSVLPTQIGEVLIHQGKIDEAVVVLSEAVERHPQSIPSLALLGQAYHQRGDHAQAIAKLEPVIEMAPGYTNAYYTIGNACARIGERERSKEYLAKFRKLKERDEQQHRDSLKSGDDLRAVQKTAAKFLVDAAQVFLANGDVASADTSLSRGLELDDTSTQAWLFRAWFDDRRGKKLGAYQALERALEVGADDLDCQLSAGQLFAKLGDFHQAKRAFQSAIELTPHQPTGYAALAKLCVEANLEIDEAVRLAETAVNLNATADYLYILAMAHRADHNKEEAIAVLQRAIKIAPEDTTYAQALAELQE